MDKQQPSQQKFSRSLVTSLEYIFAVIIGVTFFNFYEELVPLKFDFFAVTILVAFTTVIADMIGFLRNIDLRPYKTFSRYILDLIILYFYFQLLYSPLVSLEFFFKMYLLIFSAYLLWVWLEYREYKNDEDYKKTPMKIRYLRKVVCLSVGSAIWIYYAFFYPNPLSYHDYPYELATIIDWALLFSILATVIGIWVISLSKKQYVEES